MQVSVDSVFEYIYRARVYNVEGELVPEIHNSVYKKSTDSCLGGGIRPILDDRLKKKSSSRG